MAEAPLLSVRNLRVEFAAGGGAVPVVEDLSFDLAAGERLGIVGESGSGKSMTALALLGLVPAPGGRIAAGSIRLAGRELVGLPESELQAIRGDDISMIFQEPMTSLNPVYTIGEQIAETLRAHQNLERAGARAAAVELLDAVRMPEPARRARDYPHQLSGGQRQRVMIAIAIACRPRILIADEPTTALDVTVQAQIFELLNVLYAETGCASIMITHDMGVVAAMAERMIVMYRGRVMEQGRVDSVIVNPTHPYTAGLLSCVPHMTDKVEETRRPLPELGDFFAPARDAQPPDTAGTPVAPVPPRAVARAGPGAAPGGGPVLLSVRNLHVRFPLGRALPFRKMSYLDAVQDVSFEIDRGTTLGLVGESGSGKTTTARAIARLVRVHGGHIEMDGVDLQALEGEALRRHRNRLQYIFQDPYSSLNPRLRAEDVVREPLDRLGLGTRHERDARVAELFSHVGLTPAQRKLFPHQFSGGQRQRIGIARALAPKPELVICDEPVSALDVAVQAQILNLLNRLQDEFNLTYLFISHDMGVVQHMCDTVVVMREARIVEHADRKTLFENPREEYTRALLASVLRIDPTPERAPAGS